MAHRNTRAQQSTAILSVSTPPKHVLTQQGHSLACLCTSQLPVRDQGQSSHPDANDVAHKAEQFLFVCLWRWLLAIRTHQILQLMHMAIL